MRKNVLVFGAISGVIASGFMATSMAVMGCSSEKMNGNSGWIIGFTTMIVAFAFVFVGIKNYRDKQNDGILKFGRGFLLGCLISLVASTMYVITWGVEYHFFLPDFMDKYTAVQIQKLQKSGVKGEAYDEAIKNLQNMSNNYKNPFWFAMYTYVEILPVGILISLISALILKRKKAVPSFN